VTGRGLIPSLAVAALALAGCGGSSSTAANRAPTTSTAQTTTATQATLGPEGIPLEAGPPLAPASTTAPGTTIDGIQCAPSEQVAYHIHVHLQVYVNGSSRALPGGIGMVGPVPQQTAYGLFFSAQQCYYWLHTHASDGVIHIESPTQRIYTLGNFFDEWREPLSSQAVAGYTGRVTAVVNGKPWHSSPRAIPLEPHTEIELAVGRPVPAFSAVSWAGTSL